MVSQGLDSELAAMQNIASALAQLDPAARARTLQWLRQRFERDVTPAASQPTASPVAAAVTFAPLRIVSAPVAACDETLSVESIEDLFGPGRPDPGAEGAPVEAAAQPVTKLLSDFVAEFQDLAREWDGACSAPAEPQRAARLLSAVS